MYLVNCIRGEWDDTETISIFVTEKFDTAKEYVDKMNACVEYLKAFSEKLTDLNEYGDTSGLVSRLISETEIERVVSRELLEELLEFYYVVCSTPYFVLEEIPVR